MIKILWMKIKNHFETEHYLIGASILRIGFGFHILYSYLVHLLQRDYIWGPNGIYPLKLLQTSPDKTWSLYTLSNNQLYFEVIYFIGLIIAILYLIGFQTRITGLLNFIFVWSLYERNPFTLDGGNNILSICLFYLIFANVGEYFSVKSKYNKIVKSKHANILHNFSIYACITQLCIVYFFSGFFKAQGHMWTNGTALYYILNVEEYSLPSIAHFIYNNPYLVVVGSYSAIVTQIAFPFLIWNKYLKWPILIGSIGFHLAIGFLMGLAQFAIAMIALDLLLIKDKEYKKFYNFYAGVKSKKKRGKLIFNNLKL
ncbi:HTTM domain-containing protein [Bacillus toyonensis]|uniref:HTTM domain-containing protein n=1 Tax=Bacillus toyonensis TaxID=155322 RepID=UPI00211DA13C|nr:HTTM domain-containing protein [Bacillus toyonensis]